MGNATQLAEQTGIRLDPIDWFRATWRDLDPLPRPEYLTIETPPLEFLKLGLEDDSAHTADKFAVEVLPYLSRDERNALRELVRRELALAQFPSGWNQYLPRVFLFAAFLGVHEPLETLVRSWQDNYFGKYAYRSTGPIERRPSDIVMGLGDPDAMIFHMRRLNLPIRPPEAIRAWLANTELKALDVIQRCILTEKGVRKTDIMVNTLGLAVHPVVAPLMLETMASSRGTNAAQKWLDEHPHEAIAGLIPIAERRDKLAANAVHYLQGLARSGKTALIEKYAGPKLLAKLIDQSVMVDLPRFDKETTPEWLSKGVREVSRLSAADTTRTIDFERLPLLVIDGYALNTEQVEAVLLAIWLNRSGRSIAQPTVLAFAETLKTHIGQPAFDVFTWALVNGWLNAGAPTIDRWLLGGLSLLGSDQLIFKFYPLIVDWAAKKNKKLFQIGLECLSYVGSDIALMELFRLEQTLKSKTLHQLIRKQIEKVIETRKLTEDELLDRTAPHCGLDANGGHTFDYGPRQFQLLLHHSLTPRLRDMAGKQRRDLPKPTAQDDPEKASAALNEWQYIKQNLRDAAKSQSVRLERQMVNQWQWYWTDFERYFLRHPFMQHVAQLLVWGCYKNSALKQSFRVMDDGTFTDAQDQALAPDRSAKIGIIHPLQMSDSERGAWGQLLHDYDIIPPFPQLGRELYRLTPDEIATNQINRFGEASAHVLSFYGKLMKLGWENTNHLQRWMPGFNVTIIASEDSNVGGRDGYVALDSLHFYAGQTTGWRLTDLDPLKLDEVSPVVISEVIRDLTIVFKA